MSKKERYKLNFIISVPFLRNIRHSLSTPFIDHLSKYGNVSVVSPFIITNDDIDYLHLQNIKLIHPEIKETKLSKKLLQISDNARRSGYFRKSKKYGMPYYYNDAYSKFNKSGYFENFSLIVSCFIWMLSFVFQIRILWTILEYLACMTTSFDDQTKSYLKSLDNVVYLQSSNWGIQDRLLSILSSKYKWKSVMIPYTTDQLHATGHLLKKHNFYAVQSNFEKNLAIDLHNIAIDKIQIIGSLWFRNIDYQKKLLKLPTFSKDRKKNIVYAGVSDQFFPRLTEIKSVKEIAMNFPEFQINYYPYVKKTEFPTLCGIFSDFNNVTLLPHSEKMTELISETTADFREDMIEHMNKISNVDIFVMSYTTSMCLDANYVSRCPIIANFIDDFSILKKRNMDMFPKNMLGKYHGKYQTNVFNYNQLVDSIQEALNLKTIEDKDQPFMYWDCEKNLNDELSELIKKL